MYHFNVFKNWESLGFYQIHKGPLKLVEIYISRFDLSLPEGIFRLCRPGTDEF
jgi:hypothetical protein